MPRIIAIGFALILALATVAADQARGGEEDKARDPAAVLAGKGLVREGTSYVLADDEGRGRRLRELDVERKAFIDQIEPLDAQRFRLAIEVMNAKRNAERMRRTEEDVARYDQARMALATFDRDAGPGLMDLKRKRLDVERERIKLAKEIRVRYQALWDERSVREALREMNRTARPRMVLGPASDQGEYLSKLRFAAATYLTERGLIVQERPPCLLVPAEVEAARAHREAQRLRKTLAALEAKGPAAASRAADLSRRRKALADQLSAAGAERKRRLTLQIGVLDDQARRLAPGGDGDATSARERAAQLSSARDEYVAAVEALRAAADAAPGQRRAIEADPEVVATLAELKDELNGPLRIVHHPQWREALAFLAVAEAGIHAERVPLVAGSGPGGEPTVLATLDGTLAVAMAIDPRVALTRIPSEAAARLGLATSEEGSESLGTLPNGRALTARRATLRSVRVGSFAAEDVACLVLPADASGVPAALGADFLDRFACRVLPDRGAFRIARVDPVAVRPEDSPSPARPPGR
jgi:hypothetical protein